MKKQMSLFVWAIAMFGAGPLLAATNSGMRAASSADLTNGPAYRVVEDVDCQKYQTKSNTRSAYMVQDDSMLYYSTPSNRSQLYKQYDDGNGNVRTVRKNRSETVRTELKRKYYLSHPFFQPLKGKFGSITDFSYSMDSYDLAITQTVEAVGAENPFGLSGVTGKWDMGRFQIKEDLSFGITDRIAIIGMVGYDSATYKFKWDDPIDPDDKMTESGLNPYGLGLQWRFIDTDDWIATAAAHFQHQRNYANMFTLEAKAGYKVSSSTIYGLVRGWLVDFEGNSYGNAVTDGDEMMYIAYETDVDTKFFVEGGLGVFSVLDEDWFLNVEMLFGNYAWHNQASVRGLIGWQPNDWFALNLYAKTSFFDSADDQIMDLYWRAPQYDQWKVLSKVGSARIDNYSELSFGAQAIFYF